MAYLFTEPFINLNILDFGGFIPLYTDINKE